MLKRCLIHNLVFQVSAGNCFPISCIASGLNRGPRWQCVSRPNVWNNKRLRETTACSLSEEFMCRINEKIRPKPIRIWQKPDTEIYMYNLSCARSAKLCYGVVRQTKSLTCYTACVCYWRCRSNWLTVLDQLWGDWFWFSNLFFFKGF